MSIMEVETNDHAAKEQATRDLRDATVDEADKTGETVDNENVDIESSTGTKTALSLNATNTVRSVTVQSTRHPHYGDRNGYYFFFDQHHWSTVFGDVNNMHTFVVQTRGGAEVWRGVVTTWSNSNGVHGRRFSGAANSQWQVGDRLIPPGNPSVVVVQRDCCTRNDHGRTRPGKYFWFNMRQWQATFGSRGRESVVQSRDKLTIWRGNVYAWDNNRDGDGQHGRRDPIGSAHPRQFRTGDVLSAPGGSLENPWHPNCNTVTNPVGYWHRVKSSSTENWGYKVQQGRQEEEETTRTEGWERSVESSISATLTFGSNEGGLDGQFSASTTVSTTSGSKRSASTEVRQALTRTFSVEEPHTESRPGTIWQFAIQVRDSCGVSHIRTSDTAWVRHEVGNEPPCCMPTESLRPDFEHGPCKAGSKCTCSRAVCDGTAPNTTPATTHCPNYCSDNSGFRNGGENPCRTNSCKHCPHCQE